MSIPRATAINSQDWFKAKLDLFKDDPEFRMEEVILDITEHVTATMRDLGIDRAELARRMGVSEREITRLLAGDRDMFTREVLETLGKILGEEFDGTEFASRVPSRP
jgi:ribosome-binding protein aMBF1 (putative translation factor)